MLSGSKYLILLEIMAKRKSRIQFLFRMFKLNLYELYKLTHLLVLEDEYLLTFQNAEPRTVNREVAANPLAFACLILISKKDLEEKPCSQKDEVQNERNFGKKTWLITRVIDDIEPWSVWQS